MLADALRHAAGHRVGDTPRNAFPALDRALVANWTADRVAHRAGMLLRNHVANLVATSALLRNHVANLVAAGLAARFAHPLRAANFFVYTARDPTLLAALARRALHTLSVALARAVAAAA